MTDRQPGLVDALFEVGKQRQEILNNLRSAFEEKNLDRVLTYVGQLVGLDEKLKEAAREEGN